MEQVGIIGLGWVGKAMQSVFPDAVIYDISMPETSMELINDCDVAFVCVPTPNKGKDELDTSIVEKVISECDCPLIVVRSTVNPGDCDRWEKLYEKNICMQPEYLGETVAHVLMDEGKRPWITIGGRPENRRKLIELYHRVYNANIEIRQVDLKHAEVIKLSENRAIMYKVAQCQELYDACQKNEVDYYTIRDAVYGDDPRFNLHFTFVYPDKRGANSKCIPKDVYAWAAWAGEAPLTEAVLNYNETLIKE